MTTVIKRLEQEDLGFLHEMCRSIYLEGECYAFATALHRGLGWPMVGIMDFIDSTDKKVIRHVAVKSPDEILYDARGVVSDEELGVPFDLHSPYEMRTVTEDELVRDRETAEVRERSIRMAQKFAETLWPNLPWKESFESRVKAFADALESLSREHELWIRSPVPASLLPHQKRSHCG